MRHRHVAIIGSGPAGFYAAEELLRRPDISVDMIERLPHPFGLVRAGIAPDHQKTKMVTRAFERTAASPRYRFFGNVEVGLTVSVEKLHYFYDALVFAHGSAVGRRLSIEGGGLRGVVSANEFVGWYNGHPDFALTDIEVPADVVVVGNGNVAGDVARLLLKPLSQLEHTDITDRALRAIKSLERRVHIIGRKSLADSRFSSPEFKELLGIPGLDVSVASAVELDEAAASGVSDNARRNIEYLEDALSRPRAGTGRQVIFYFGSTPLSFYGDQQISGVKVQSGDQSVRQIPCGLIVQCIGNVGKAMDGLPFDMATGRVRNDRGRVKTGATVLPGLYVTGWAKRGATGTVGTNRLDSVETCNMVLEDLANLPARRREPDELFEEIARSGVYVFSYSDWLKIDEAEVKAGAGIKPREKILEIDGMINALGVGKESRVGA